jgi:CheY-like chemotaxis protein
MTQITDPIVMLMAEDDADDRMFALDAMRAGRVNNDLRTVENGEQALDFLYQRNGFEDAPRPGLVMLDLNMPKLGGLDVLKAMKADSSLRPIPVVILTTSKAEEDRLRSYNLVRAFRSYS